MARKKKDSENLQELTLAVEEATELPTIEEAVEEPSPQPTRAKRTAKVEETVVAAPPPVVVPAPPEKDRVVQQWEAAKQASESIVASLEKVNDLLREIPEHYGAVIQKSMKQAATRPSPAARVAFVMSVVATLLSILSLSFSQSAREKAFSQATYQATQVQQPQHVRSATPDLMAAAPKQKAKRLSK
jgi:hypothetical protein